MKKLLNSPIFSAILGGLVVAVVFVAVGIVGPRNTSTVYKEMTPTGTAAKSGGALSAREIYRRDAPGVVNVKARIEERTQSPFDPFGSVTEGEATGSGFVLDTDGHIVTNAHVIDKAKSIQVVFSDEKSVVAEVVGKDLGTDLALLKVKPKNLDLKPLEMGNSDALEVGDPTIAIGNPFGLDRTLTTGVVSAIQRKISAPNGLTIENVIQTDAAINPGNSGGPLIDSNGRVVGINSQIATAGGSGGSVGIGFAVPVSTAKKIIPQLKQSGTVKRAYLGVVGRGIDETLKPLNLKAKSGVLVQSVQKGSGAAKAGLKGGTSQVTIGGQPILLGGDIIQSANGKKITGMDQLIQLVTGMKPGETMKLNVLRDGKAKQFEVKLGTRPANTSVR